MSSRSTAIVLVGLVATFYGALTLPVLMLIASRNATGWFLFALLHECVALGLAIELAELLLALSLPESRHPTAAKCRPAEISVAVLYLCRDDVDHEALTALTQLRDLDTFILDDSTDPAQRGLLDATGLRILRRIDRRGFKAGSLNHWLSLHARSYRYFVVLDADSVVTTEAVWQLVGYAEHPKNADVAIVQSTIRHRQGNRFQDQLSALESLRARILNRVHDRVGWSLSYGHNNLHRVDAIEKIGRFETFSTCEDTIASLRLRQEGWRVILVDTVTFDSEPADVVAYRKRMVRWARQTLEVILKFRGAAGWSLNLLLARHLFSYVLPTACIGLLALMCLSRPMTWQEGWDAFSANMLLKGASMWPGLIGYMMAAAFLGLIGARIGWAMRHGVRGRMVLSGALLGGSIVAFCAWDVVAGLIRSFIGQPVGFSPTGQKTSSGLCLTDLLCHMRGPWLIYAGLALSLIRSPGAFFFGLSYMWCALLLGAPVVLWVFHRSREGRHVAQA